MTQRDSLPQPDVRDHALNDAGATQFPASLTGANADHVSVESGGIPGFAEDAVEAQESLSISRGCVDAINAVQVTMDRSGAENIRAQRVFMTNSGARSVETRTSKLTQSGVLQLQSDKIELHQSSVVMAKSGELQMDRGSIGFSTSEKVTLHNGANVSVLQARSVEVVGNVRAFMLFSKKVNAGANIETTIDSRSAAIFGAAFGAACAFVWKVIGRR